MLKIQKTLKVSELIKLLQEHPPDAEVVTEGCDCDGDAGGVVTRSESPNKVFITRTTFSYEVD